MSNCLCSQPHSHLDRASDKQRQNPPPSHPASYQNNYSANALLGHLCYRRSLHPGNHTTSPRINSHHKHHSHPAARPLANLPLNTTHNNQASPLYSLILARPATRGNTLRQNQQSSHADSHPRCYSSNPAHSQPHRAPNCHLPNHQANPQADPCLNPNHNPAYSHSPTSRLSSHRTNHSVGTTHSHLGRRLPPYPNNYSPCPCINPQQYE